MSYENEIRDTSTLKVGDEVGVRLASSGYHSHRHADYVVGKITRVSAAGNVWVALRDVEGKPFNKHGMRKSTLHSWQQGYDKLMTKEGALAEAASYLEADKQKAVERAVWQAMERLREKARYGLNEPDKRKAFAEQLWFLSTAVADADVERLKLLPLEPEKKEE